MKHSVRTFLKWFFMALACTCAVISCYYQPKPQIKKIKIFLEVYATSPALWESVELIKSLPNQSELKVFFFHRFPKRSNILDLGENTIEISLTSIEGAWAYTSGSFLKELEKIVQEYPTAKLEVYSNINQVFYFVYPLMKKMGEKIEHLHIYEDGACNIYGYQYNAWIHFYPFDMLDLEKKVAWAFPLTPSALFWEATVGKFVPTTYHLCKGDEIKKNKYFKNFVDWIGAENIKTLDLKRETDRLLPYEKKLLTRFFQIDPDLIKKKNNQKTLLLTTGYFLNREAKLKNEIDSFQPVKNLPYRVLLKCHPSLDAQKECIKIKKAFPEWIALESNTPVEALFLTGHEPDLVGGFSSSLYFMIPPEKILFVLGTQYMYRLLKMGIINENQQEVPH